MEGAPKKDAQLTGSRPDANIADKNEPTKKKPDLKQRLLSKHDEDFICSVCSDRASGYHYGVPACEGCKAFFKRSLQQQNKELNYKCPGNSTCNIDKMSRKCCQACRLRKCKEVGMSREYLGSKIKKSRSDKSVSRKRKRTEAQVDNLDSSSVDSPPTERDQDSEDIISTLALLHKNMYTTCSTAHSDNFKEKLCNVVGHQLICIIDWAKRLPGYRQLEITDQAILLQAGWIELLLLQWLYHSSLLEGFLKLEESLSLSNSDADRLGMGNIYNLVCALATRSRNYKIDEEDIACLKAIALVNSESCNLSDKSAVNELIQKYTLALQYYSNTRYYMDAHKYPKLLLILPQLKYLANQLMEYFYAMKLSEEERVLLSDLVIEMLEAKQRL